MRERRPNVWEVRVFTGGGWPRTSTRGRRRRRVTSRAGSAASRRTRSRRCRSPDSPSAASSAGTPGCARPGVCRRGEWERRHPSAADCGREPGRQRSGAV